MTEQLLNHLESRGISRDARFLLAVSGGMDSMVMLDLFVRLDATVVVAHCNFQLRSEESHGDEQLVRSVCSGHGIECLVKRFDPRSYACDNGVSVQMAARTLRYEWFEALRIELACEYVATAHHLDDSLETVLLNLTRGTGIDGIQGIPFRSGHVIRPLLFADRQAVAAYATHMGISWREDSSNASDKYARNKIRNSVIPHLKSINPSLLSTWAASQDRIQAGVYYAHSYVNSFTASHTRSEGNDFIVEALVLRQQHYPAELLWMILKDFGFNYDQCRDITGRVHQTGALFTGVAYSLVVQGDRYIVRETSASIESSLVITEPGEYQLDNNTLKLTLVEAHGYTIDSNRQIAALDMRTLRWPLVWRSWKPGDRMVPLGMKFEKKISDILVDDKVHMLDKQRVTVLSSGSDVVWLVGRRISDRFKLTSATEQLLLAELLPGQPATDKA